MAVDLKKEIKLSDLFRRKRPDAAPSAGAEPKKPKKERRPRRPAGAAVAPKAAPEVPAIPLMRAINLMPTEEARERSGSRLGLAQVLVALLGILLVAGLGGATIFMGARVSDRQRQADDLRAQLADLQVPAEAPAKPHDPQLAGEGQARTVALAGALQGRVAWDRILREVSLVLPEKLHLEQISATTVGVATTGATTITPTAEAPAADPNSLTLVGVANEQALVAQFLARLEAVPEFSQVALQSSTYNDDADTYSFSLVAQVVPGGAS